MTHGIDRPSAHPAGSRRTLAGLALILSAATLLRFWGLSHGIPFSVGVDEPEIMERAVRIMKTGDFNPHFFDYPSLYLYVQAIVSIARFLHGATIGKWPSLAQASTSDFYLWGRAVTAVAGTATVAVLYSAARRWDTRTALIAAAIMAVMPMHVRESHFVLTDVPMTLFVTLTLLLSLRARERPTVTAFAVAGIAAGLATATKYNGALALIMPLIVSVFAPMAQTSRLRAVLAVLGGSVVAFLVAAPYTVLDLPTFLNEFARLSAQYRNAPVAESIPILYLKHLRKGFGWPTSFVVLLGLGLGVTRAARGPERVKWTLAIAFPLLYFWFVSNQHIVFGRYLLPIVPFLAVWAASAVLWIMERVSRPRVPRRVQAFVVAGLILLVILPVAYQAVMFDKDASRTWTTAMAYEWVLKNVPEGSGIAIETRGLLLPPKYKITNVKQLRAHSVADYANQGMDYLVASSQVYGPYTSDPQTYPQEYLDYARIFREAQEVVRFSPSKDHPGPEWRVLKVAR